MRSIWQSLAWKEWHEHKWKLVSILTVLMGLMAFIALVVVGERQALEESFQVSILLGGIPLAIFIGLGIAAGEQSRGTLRFLQALPVPMWRVALQKIAFGLLSLVIPILCVALFVAVYHPFLHFFGASAGPSAPTQGIFDGRALWSGNWIVDITCSAVLIAGSLFIWSAACGVNRKDEVSAGAVALGVMVAWWFVLTFLWFVLLKGTSGPDTARLRAVGIGSAPIGFEWITDISKADIVSTYIGFGAFALTLILLVTAYVVRFGRTSERDIRSPRGAIGELRRSDFLGPPRRFAITAVAWKQARESGPVVAAGLFAIIAIVASFCVGMWFSREGMNFKEAGLIYGRVAIVFGFFIALVAGIGVSLNDSGPSLNTFWRSRAIQPDLWFWVKFTIGLMVVMAAIYAPISLIAAFGDTGLNEDLNVPDSYTIAAMQITVYASAVLVTCLVRQAVYAAILSIAVVYVGILASLGTWMVAGFFGLVPLNRAILWEPTTFQVTAGLVATFIVCTILAWLAMRFDWGRKSRY